MHINFLILINYWASIKTYSQIPSLLDSSPQPTPIITK
ncbi:hypothetical protein VPH5P1C_0156 [Vibrio phage 5P1c]